MLKTCLAATNVFVTKIFQKQMFVSYFPSFLEN